MRRSFLLIPLLFAGFSLSAQNYPTDGLAVSTALADFNRDGYTDMAVVNQAFAPNGDVAAIDIFINNHSGGFGPYTSYATPSTGPVLAVDVNGDGWPDLVVAPGQGTVSTIFLNNGNGTFHMGTPPTTEGTVISFVAGDFNKDGKADLAAFEGVGCDAAGCTKYQIEILLNKGNGTFTAGQILAMSGGSSGGVVGDFDNDGNLDIANVEGKALVWWGKGDGTFGAPTQIKSPVSNGFSSLTGADFNNDGLEDLAMSVNDRTGCTDPTDPICGTTTAYVYKNLGGRAFSLASSTVFPYSAGGTLYSADLNGDLNMDLVNLVNAAGDYNGDLSVKPGNGNMTFGANQDIDQPSAYEVDFRDLNLDSRTDIVIPQYFPSGEVFVQLATSGNKTCPGLGSATLAAKICAPANNATVTSPVLVTAAGNSPIGVKRLEVWVDGKKVYQKLGDHLNKKIAMSAGSHRVTVVAVDQYVGTTSKVEYVTVQ